MSIPNPTTTTPPPLTLTYDNYTPAKDPNNRRLLPAYWLGTLLAGLLYAAILTPIVFVRDRNVGFSAILINGLLLPIGFAIVFSLPDTLFLGLTLWLRTKLLHHARFAKFTTALLTGFIAGLFPIVLIQFLELPEETSFKIFLAFLAWHVLYPTAAAFWLCYKSHLRDT